VIFVLGRRRTAVVVVTALKLSQTAGLDAAAKAATERGKKGKNEMLGRKRENFSRNIQPFTQTISRISHRQANEHTERCQGMLYLMWVYTQNDVKSLPQSALEKIEEQH